MAIELSDRPKYQLLKNDAFSTAFQRVQASTSKNSQSLQNNSGFVPQRSLIETQQTFEFYPSKIKRESQFTFDFTQIPVHGFPTPAPIQPKLAIGQPRDKYEAEVDKIAHQVVQRMHKPQGDTVQREEKPEEDEEKLRMKPIQQFLSDEADMSATPDFEASIQQVRI